MGTHSPFLKLHAPTDFAVHGWQSYQVPLARIELTVPDYETGALPLSDKGRSDRVEPTHTYPPTVKSLSHE